METIYAILGLAVFLGLGYVLYQARRAASKAVNRHVLFRSEHQEGKQLVSEPSVFKARATKEKVMRELGRYVAVAPDHSAYKAVVYISSRREDGFNYAYGNKYRAKTFEATLRLTADGGITSGVLKMLSWHEQSGIVSGQETMKALRDQIEAAFAAADGTENAGTQGWVCGCGAQNKDDAAYCGNCGAKRPMVGEA